MGLAFQMTGFARARAGGEPGKIIAQVALPPDFRRMSFLQY